LMTTADRRRPTTVVWGIRGRRSAVSGHFEDRGRVSL